MTERDLMKLKDKIALARDTVNKLEGRLEAAKEALKRNWECDTLEEADKKLKDLQARREALQEKIDKHLTKIDTEYELIQTDQV